MRILIIVSTWFLLVWSFHTDRQEYKPIYAISDYEDFTIQEDSLPSSLISWLDNTHPNTSGSKRQRVSEEERRHFVSKSSCVFYCPAVIFLHNSKAFVMAAAVQHIANNLSIKIFIHTCRLRL